MFHENKNFKVSSTTYQMKSFRIILINSIKYMYRMHYIIYSEVSKSSVFGFKILIPLFTVTSK